MLSEGGLQCGSGEGRGQVGFVRPCRVSPVQALVTSLHVEVLACGESPTPARVRKTVHGDQIPEQAGEKPAGGSADGPGWVCTEKGRWHGQQGVSSLCPKACLGQGKRQPSGGGRGGDRAALLLGALGPLGRTASATQSWTHRGCPGPPLSGPLLPTVPQS